MKKFYSFVGRLGCLFLISLLSIAGYSQQRINLNKPGQENRPEISLKEKAGSPFFAQAKRARPFAINPSLANRPEEVAKGQKLQLQLFSDKNFSSTVVRKVTDVNNVTTLTLKLDKFKYGYAYITTSGNSYLITVDIPELNEKYASRKDPSGKGVYLFMLDPQKLEILEDVISPVKDRKKSRGLKDVPNDSGSPTLNSEPLEESTLELNPVNCNSSTGFSEAVVIDLLIVYTPAAKDWADVNESGIENTIANAMALANTVSQNNNLGIIFNLASADLVEYTETDSNEDLYSLYHPEDGVLDDVHLRRKEVGADMVAMFSYTDDVGGIAYLLNSKYGNSSLPFSLTRVQQATNSFTFVHELGHNMGVSHYKYQEIQPGPTTWRDWGENSWSGGWRWEGSDLNMYNTVMTYQSGRYYPDGKSSSPIPYFSDPNNIYMDGKAGNEFEGDNSRTLRVTKYLTADYSNSIAYCEAYGEDKQIAYITEVSLGQITSNSGNNGYSDFSSVVSCIFPQESQSLIIKGGGSSQYQKYRVWVDWNNDNLFDDTEIELDLESTTASVTGQITAPLNVSSGIKRVRIRTVDGNSEDGLNSCGTSLTGEVEDFALNVLEPATCEQAIPPQNIVLFEQQSNFLSLAWDAIEGISAYNLRFRKLGDTDWTLENDIFYPNFKLDNLSGSTDYEIQVSSRCNADNKSEYSSSFLASTTAPLSHLAFVNQITQVEANLEFDLSIEIVDITGVRSNATSDVSILLRDLQETGAQLTGFSKERAVDGIVTFKGLSINKAGNFLIEAEVEGLPVVQSETISVRPYASSTFIVNSIADNSDSDLSDLICADINGDCTLRAAIENVNKTYGKDSIHFNIPGSGPHRINVNSNLPSIISPVVMDATTQSGYAPGAPIIVLSGENIPEIDHEENGTGIIPHDEKAIGFNLVDKSSGSVIKGFSIGGFGVMYDDVYHAGVAIYASSTTDHLIQSNFIGLDADGETVLPNIFGIVIGHPEQMTGNTLVGGSTPEERNVISGNLRDGIHIGYYGSQNQIIGNYIGTNSTGSTVLANDKGVSIGVWAHDNFVIDNIISGNYTGIEVRTHNNQLQGNLVGLDANGQSALGNNIGILVTGHSNSIGGIGMGNVISGNTSGLIFSSQFSSEVYENKVQGNLIGLNQNGLVIPNSLGIGLFSNLCFSNTIGGDKAGEGNFISGNSDSGVIIDAPENIIIGNFIGVSTDGTSPLGNEVHGILVDYRGIGSTIGGELPELRNTIAHNKVSGITLANNNSLENFDLTGNIYLSNAQGIDLGANGKDRNDKNDSDIGPNRFQNYPEFSESATLETGNLQVNYTLSSDPTNSAFPLRIDFFKSDGNQQGAQYLGSDIFTTNDIPKGKQTVSAVFSLSPDASLISGDFIVATATDANGNTSEFSAEVQVVGDCTPQTWYVDADSDTYGVDSVDSNISSCTKPQGNYVTRAGDCEDTDPAINPEAEDIPDDGIDQNCDGVDATTGFIDTDKDGIADSVDNCPTMANPDQADANDNGIGDACEGSACLGTDVLNLSDCTSGSKVYWTVNNPGDCTVDVSYEIRKSSETGTFTLNPGESFQFSTEVASKGQTQLILYWNDSTGNLTQLQSNASGSTCSSTASTLTGTAEKEVSYEAPSTYPNPVADNGFSVSFPEVMGGKIFNARVYDLNSYLIGSRSFDVPVGGADIFWNIDTAGWIPGVYILQLENGSESHQLNLLKE